MFLSCSSFILPKPASSWFFFHFFRTQTYWKVAKGSAFSRTREKPESDLTVELLAGYTDAFIFVNALSVLFLSLLLFLCFSDQYKSKQFKPYNFNALGKDLERGALHPLTKMRNQFQIVLLEMG